MKKIIQSVPRYKFTDNSHNQGYINLVKYPIIVSIANTKNNYDLQIIVNIV